MNINNSFSFSKNDKVRLKKKDENIKYEYAIKYSQETRIFIATAAAPSMEIYCKSKICTAHALALLCIVMFSHAPSVT